MPTRTLTHACLLVVGLGSIAAGCGGRGGTVLGDRPLDGAAAGQGASARAGGRALQHLFLIMMENQATDAVLGNTADAPHINELAQHGGVALQYFGVTHPSMPNYLAVLSGDFQGIWDDCSAGPAVTCDPEEFVPDADDGTVDLLLTPELVARSSRTRHWFDARNLVDQLEAAHLTWKGYMQGLPAVGSTVEFAPIDRVAGREVSRDLYAQRHNPFMYFSDIRQRPQRMNRIVPATRLSEDLRTAETTPNFAWLSPDNCRNMHGLTKDNAAAVGIPGCALSEEEVAHPPAQVAPGTQDRDRDRGARVSGLAGPGAAPVIEHEVLRLGDAYVGAVVQEVMASPAWRERSAIVIVWDEDDFARHDGCCGSPVLNGHVLGGGRTPLIVLTSWNTERRIVNRPANHYVLLATIQHLWGLGCLGHSCDVEHDELLTDLFAVDRSPQSPPRRRR